MREIKFRGWSLTENRWIYGGVHFYDDRAIILEYRNRVQDFHSEVDLKSVGQFTGLLDKNGVEIYEGDIVNILDKTYIVSWNYGCFILTRWKNSADVTTVNQYNVPECFEVIGNVNETPDLLK